MPAKRLLFMDDSTLILEVLRGTFEDLGYDVRTAENLTELEEHVVSFRPDAVVLDVQMPEMFGDDVARVLKHVRDVDVPTLLFSSLDEQALAERVADAGLEGFVSKRDGVPALVERLTALVGGPE